MLLIRSISCFLFLPRALGASLESSVLTFIVFPTVHRSKGVLFKLQEENIKTVLMNPNIASVQTNEEGEKQVK